MDGILGLLSPEQQQMARRDATSQALLALGANLIQGAQSAPGGQRPDLLSTAIRALPGTVQAYRGSFDQTLQDMLRAQQIQDLQRMFKDKPRITKKDCYRELSMIAKHYPVTAKSSLTEYRGAQANYIDYVNSLKHGNPDNQ